MAGFTITMTFNEDDDAFRAADSLGLEVRQVIDGNLDTIEQAVDAVANDERLDATSDPLLDDDGVTCGTLLVTRTPREGGETR